MVNYEDMCKRLTAYRHELGLYQSDIGGFLGVTQEQYSYIERGTTKITDAHLKVFSKLGMDVDDLVIGESLGICEKEFATMYELFPDEGDRDFAMKIIAEISLRILEKSDIQKLAKSDRIMVTLLDAYLDEWNNFSMMTYIRLSKGKSQTDMAQIMGIGIKKYRALEKETRFPDAELLIFLHEMSGYPPSLFLDIRDRKMLLLSLVWKLLSEKDKHEITELVKNLKRVI